MNNSVLKRERSEVYLSNQEYFRLVEECHNSLNLTKEENTMLLSGAVPRFIAGIPYLSNESTPDLLATMNLISYIACSRNGEFFAQRDSETIKDRIEPYIHSVNGDKNTIELCKLVLEEVSLLDHNSDKEMDKITGHPNPINSGVIDFEHERERINREKTKFPEHVQKLVDGSFDGKVLSFFWNGNYW